VRADIVEASEFPDLAQRYNVYAVPKTVINDTAEVVGAVAEAQFVDALSKALVAPPQAG
jgi:predicted DsbA family dithiol-disulfide isomerase